MIVSTPPLRASYLGILKRKRNEEWLLCASTLARHVEIPESTTYWVEASDEQWPDESGTRVQVQINKRGDPLYAFNAKRVTSTLLTACGYYLKKLGCKRGGPAKVIYFRLLYEE